MTVIEAKKVLLAAELSPLVREAVNLLIPELEFQNLPGEIWCDIIEESIDSKGDYQISNRGRARSFHQGKLTICTQYINNKGYPYIDISKKGKRNHRCIHILVAQAFIPNPENKPEVNHINVDKLNSNVENLVWSTHSENIKHAYDTGLRASGCNRSDAALNVEQVREIRRDCVPGDPEKGFNAFGRKFNVTFTVIRKVFYRETYKNVE